MDAIIDLENYKPNEWLKNLDCGFIHDGGTSLRFLFSEVLVEKHGKNLGAG